MERRENRSRASVFAGDQRFELIRQRRDKRLRHAADVQAVVVDGDAGSAILRRLRPKMNLVPIH